MTDYSVHIEGRIPTGQKGQVTVDHVFDVVERLHAATGVTPIATYKGKTITVTINVTADDPTKAVVTGVRYFNTATRKAGLGALDINEVEALTYKALKARNATPLYPELIDLGGIAALAGVSRNAAKRLVTQPGFPIPVTTLTDGHIWNRAAVNNQINRSR